MRLLVVTAVEREADAFRSIPGCVVVVGGLGRTNAALAVARAWHEHGAFDAVLSAGIAGALPGAELSIGDVVVASASVYLEEGIATPSGFADLSSMGFDLGPFDGNVVPADEDLFGRMKDLGVSGRIATVATCSGTDEAALEVVRRTGAIAEAMEGASVLHAAATFDMPALELRVISNSTGDRDRQAWDLDLAFARLGAMAAGISSRLD